MTDKLIEVLIYFLFLFCGLMLGAFGLADLINDKLNRWIVRGVEWMNTGKHLLFNGHGHTYIARCPWSDKIHIISCNPCKNTYSCPICKREGTLAELLDEFDTVVFQRR